MRHTADSINAQIAKATSLPIRVAWDGDETRETALFAVWFGDEPADYTVEDLDHTFDVDRQIGPRHYESVGSASGYAPLARLLIDIINEDIAAGLLTEEDA
jgi:hypothetical protein